MGMVISGKKRDPLGRVNDVEDLGIGNIEAEWGDLEVYPRETGDDFVQIGLSVKSRTVFALRAMQVLLETASRMASALQTAIPTGADPVEVSGVDCLLVVYPMGSHSGRPQQVRVRLRQDNQLDIDGYMTENQVRWLGKLIERSVSGAP